MHRYLPIPWGVQMGNTLSVWVPGLWGRTAAHRAHLTWSDPGCLVYCLVAPPSEWKCQHTALCEVHVYRPRGRQTSFMFAMIWSAHPSFKRFCQNTLKISRFFLPIKFSQVRKQRIQYKNWTKGCPACISKVSSEEPDLNECVDVAHCGDEVRNERFQFVV